jgi:hypothetical protein
MSLIYDALKKAQGALGPKDTETKKEEKTNTQEPQTPEPEAASPSKPPSAYPMPPTTHFLDPNRVPEETTSKPLDQKEAKPNRTKLLLVIFGILIVVFFAKDFLFRKAAQILPQKEKKELSLNEKINKNAQKTAPLAKDIGGFTLNGIMVDQNQGNIAIINNIVLKAGDKVGNAEVVSITEKQVELNVEGNNLTLNLD